MLGKAEVAGIYGAESREEGALQRKFPINLKRGLLESLNTNLHTLR